MDPITIAVLSASIIGGLAGASIAGLKAWSGWLELKKMELAQAAAPSRPRCAGSPSP